MLDVAPGNWFGDHKRTTVSVSHTGVTSRGYAPLVKPLTSTPLGS